MNKKLQVTLAGLALLASVAAADAQGFVQRWGVGGFVDYNRPILGMQNWFSHASKAGLTFSYVTSQRTSVEVEYHRSRFGSGKLETRTFIWQVDGKPYSSPEAKADMTFNSIVFNALVRGHTQNAFVPAKMTPYMVFGTGFFHYISHVSGLIYPGQSKAPLNPAIKFNPFSDRRTALTISMGVGMEGFVTETLALDLRGRYNFSLGELRPLEDWGLKKVFSLNMVDVGVGLKFYFKK